MRFFQLPLCQSRIFTTFLLGEISIKKYVLAHFYTLRITKQVPLTVITVI